MARRKPPSTPNTQQTTANSQFVKKVHDNAVYAKNITAKIDFSIMRGDKEISVGGKLLMRRDEVIRIQLNVPLIGMEAGRLEFTKDYVLIVDRIHSEYVKGDYNQVDFLKNNGLNFYALQALFWNQLFVPGQTKVTDAMLKLFTAEILNTQQPTPITLEKDNMKYTWLANSQSGLIQRVDVDYNSKSSGSTHVSCEYADFKAMGVKSFPNSITLNMQTTAQLPTGTKKMPKNMKLGIRMKSVDNDSKWDAFTTVSKKYKQVSVDDVLKKIMSM
ncbi:MAG: DUF4292 domain-containing protein [Prevotella sp.]|nr:DUF4292 domain-containing protein [Prevotella sp.]